MASTGVWILDTKSLVGPLQRRRLVDDATHALRDAILDGRLSAGARLRQTDLAERLRISRTPIREALGRLQQEGLVDLLPRGGVRVVLLDPDEAVELYELREMLDGLAARLAASRHDGDRLATCQRALERMARCVERPNASQWFAAHVLFHEEIFRAAGNRRLQRLLPVVRLSIRQFHPLLLRTERRLETAYAEHRRILEAIAAHDAEAAEREARAHIVHAREIVLKLVTRGAGDAAVQG
jgi:DNA-binding GntR family transcriptional regulator